MTTGNCTRLMIAQRERDGINQQYHQSGSISTLCFKYVQLASAEHTNLTKYYTSTKRRVDFDVGCVSNVANVANGVKEPTTRLALKTTFCYWYLSHATVCTRTYIIYVHNVYTAVISGIYTRTHTHTSRSVRARTHMSVCIHRDVYDMCCDEGVLSDVVGCRRPSFCVVDVVVDRSPVVVFPSSRYDHAARARHRFGGSDVNLAYHVPPSWNN